MAKTKVVEEPELVPEPEPEPEPEPIAAVDPVYGQDVLVDLDGSGSYHIIHISDINGYDFQRDGLFRTLYLGPGVGYVEHVDTHPTGVWCYRKM